MVKRTAFPEIFGTLGTLILAANLLFLSGCGSNPKGESDHYIIALGAYTKREAHVKGRATGINLLSLDRKTGMLTRHNGQPGMINPSFIAIHPELPIFYNVNEHAIDDMGGINQIRVFPATDDLKLLRSLQSGGTAPCHISLDRTGKLLLISNYSSGTLATYPVDDKGNVVPPYRLHRLTDDPNQPSHAHMALATPENRFVYVTDLGQDSILLFRINENLDGLTRVNGFPASQPGSGPRHLDFHPELPILYVINELNATVDVFERDPDTGQLDFLQNVAITTHQEGQGSGAAIHLHPSGAFLYTSNRGDYDEITCFRVDPANGQLQLEATYPSGGDTPRDFAISPDGKFLVVANQDSETMRVYRIDPKSGVLTQAGADLRVLSPASVAFFPSWIDATTNE
jgi:6-phosphogluconolactonase